MTFYTIKEKVSLALTRNYIFFLLQLMYT